MPEHTHRWTVMDSHGHHETLQCVTCGEVRRVYVD